MKFRSLILLPIILFACNTDKNEAQTTESEFYNGTPTKEVNYRTSDGITIFADLVEQGKAGRTIILFHQAGANGRSEYRNVVPRLYKEDFNLLIVDQRSGGQRFGEYNRTVAAITENYEYCEAYPDFVASVDFLRTEGYTGDIMVWGSSYSAALAIQLAANHKEVHSALAFSPASGGPMEACSPNPYIESMSKPLMVLRPAREMEVESVADQFELAKANERVTYIAENGVHGSSMLDPSRTKSDVEDTWKAVLNFLN